MVWEMTDGGSLNRRLNLSSRGVEGGDTHHLFGEMPSHQEATTGGVLRITVSHVLYPVTKEVLHQILEVYSVEKMSVVERVNHVEAMVQLRSWQEAKQARDAFHGRCIYEGCCFLDILLVQPTPDSASSMTARRDAEVPAIAPEVIVADAYSSPSDNEHYHVDTSIADSEVPVGDNSIKQATADVTEHEIISRDQDGMDVSTANEHCESGAGAAKSMANGCNHPNTMQLVSALLDAEDEQEETQNQTLNAADNQEETHAPILNTDNLPETTTPPTRLTHQVSTAAQNSYVLRCWQRISEFWSIPEEPLTDHDLLPVMSISIIGSLAGCDQEISKATDLLPKIVGFTGYRIDTTNHEAQQKVLVKSSLEVLQRLTKIDGEIGVTLRYKISEDPFLLNNLAEILEDSCSSQELRELTIDIITKLAMDEGIRHEIGSIQVILTKLMYAFLARDGPSNAHSDCSMPIKAGQALAMLTLESVDNCLVLKYHSNADLKNALLHMMIQAILYVKLDGKDCRDHGPNFYAWMDAINSCSFEDHQRPPGGYNITTSHDFSQEESCNIYGFLWKWVSRYEGDLVTECYFAKSKLVWEVLDGGLKSKIENPYLESRCSIFEDPEEVKCQYFERKDDDDDQLGVRRFRALLSPHPASDAGSSKSEGEIMPKTKNPQVFLDISIGGRAAERITFELFSNVVPMTTENFRALCTGERGLGASTQKPLYFKGTNIHRIVKGFVAQGGDFSRGDGCGGESIYGGKFPDESFKLKHDQPGVLSMANAGADSNGSQFFISFKPLPHLDGKHVVFGKVVSGIPLLKKLEAVGSDSGKPTCQVKIIDCGEVSDINTQNQLQGEKEKKLRRAEGNSDAEGRVETKKTPSDDRRRKKRKHYSSDSCSSDTSGSWSYSSDSGSESESYSSSSLDTSSSSDHRNKRRKGSKKEKRKSAKRKSNNKKSKTKSRGTKRKSKRSYGSSSDDSKSSKTSSSSSDSGSAGRHAKHSLKKADQENTKMVNLDKGITLEDADKGKQTVTTGNISHEGSKTSNKDENGADDRSGNQNSEDRTSKFRDDPGASSRSSLIRADANLTKADGNSGADAAEAGISRAGTERNPLNNEPVPTNGKKLAMGSTDNRQPQRIRKGRGFTQQYAFACRYRTPSPERSPVRSRYNGGRNDRWNHFNRYGRNGPYGARSPVRTYRGSPRASSPSRYPRRDQSRSRSRSPVRRRDRGGYRRPSPRRSRSPTEQQRRDVSNRPRSGRGGGGPDHRGSSPPANRGRSRSRSKSRDPSRSRSPDAAPVKKGSSKYNRRRSSSRSSSPAGSKGLVSY